MDSFYTELELQELGLKKVGYDVSISRNACIYGAENICIGNHIRIDDFAILSGKIEIGNHVHIAAGTYLYGGTAGIVMRDYSGISSHGSVYAATDDCLGRGMTNPTVPMQYRNVEEAPVEICRHVIIGARCVVLPGVVLAEGTAVGAMSLVNKDTQSWMVYTGAPIRALRGREKLYDMQKELETMEQNEKQLYLKMKFDKRK